MKSWNYQNRRLIELTVVIVAMGLCLAMAFQILPVYVAEARLVQTVYLAKDIQNETAIDAALTGKFELDPNKLEEKIKATTLIDSGSIIDGENFQFYLTSKDLALNKQAIGFSIYHLTSGSAYDFQILACGDAEAPSPYHVTEKAKSSLLPIYTHSICAEKLNVHRQ